jgi:hypothetical protein
MTYTRGVHTNDELVVAYTNDELVVAYTNDELVVAYTNGELAVAAHKLYPPHLLAGPDMLAPKSTYGPGCQSPPRPRPHGAERAPQLPRRPWVSKCGAGRRHQRWRERGSVRS